MLVDVVATHWHCCNFYGEMMGTTGTDANWRRLAAAILARAILDAQAAAPLLAAPACRWLASQGADWAGWLDLDHLLAIVAAIATPPS